MTFVFEMVISGFIVPAAVSVAIAFSCHRWLPLSVSRRCGLAVALSTGFVAGYALTTPWMEWAPTRHWHWLPYLAVAAMIIGPIGFARGVWAVERWWLGLILAFASACVLVPSWESLQPTRNLHVGFLTVYLFGLITGIPQLADRLPATVFMSLLLTVAIILSVMILVTISIRYGQLAGLLAAALLGSCLGGRWYENPRALHGLVPVFSVLAGGLAFVGYLEPQPPLSGILVIPASPLVLWATALLPLPKDGRIATMVHVMAVALVLTIGVGWVLLLV